MENKIETERMIFRIIYIFKRLMDQTVSKKHLTAESGLNVTYLPYIMNIGYGGISNTELVNQIKVTRQAVSKTVKEMEHAGIVYSVKSENDARTMMVYLAEKGKLLFDAIKVDGMELSDQYKKILGNARYEKMIDNLLDIVAFHEKAEKDEKNK